MKDFFKKTRNCIDTYNEIQDKMSHGSYDTTDDEDEFVVNFSLYLSHALIKDFGFGQVAREELSKVGTIIQDYLM